MNKTTVILFHGILLVFVQLVLAIASQQVDEGNYIVPRTTLELSSGTNKSAGKQPRCLGHSMCSLIAASSLELLICLLRRHHGMNKTSSKAKNATLVSQ